MTVTVRAAVDGDIAAIRAIYADHVEHGVASFELTATDEAEIARRRDAVIKAGLPYLVADIGGVVAGFAAAGPYRARPAYRHSIESTVYVDAACHGRGIGGALLSALIDSCEALGCRQMIAIIGDSENAPSIRLHESQGFRRAGLLQSVGFKHGRWLDSIFLQRALGDGDESLP